MPLRFTKVEWHRIAADAKRLGWNFVIAAVAPLDGTVVFLSPQAAKAGKAVTIGKDAIISNLLAWLD
jgi:hypothetical protein